MSEKKITKLDFEELQKYKRSDNEFYILGIEIWEIDSELWNQEITLKFVRCEFKEQIIFPSRKRARVKARIAFQDCIFEKFVGGEWTIFENDFECRTCIFDQEVEFSQARFKGKVDFKLTEFRNRIIFVGTRFEGDKNIFREVIFNGDAKFNCAVFNETVDFGKSEFKEVGFRGVQFRGNENIFCATQFKEKASFYKSIFKGDVNFSDSVFFKPVYFKNSQFGSSEMDWQENAKVDFSQCYFRDKADFSSSKFLKDTYFHHTIFEKDIQFYRSYFEKVANFCFTEFKEIPNFSMCVFNHSKLANFVGVIPLFSIDTIGDYIDEKIDDESKEGKKKYQGETYLSIQHSHNIRDTFRVIKEALIAQNNLLDSQIWHKMELYAKELEGKYYCKVCSLEQDINDLKKQNEPETEIQKMDLKRQEDFFNSMKTNKLKNLVEKWQLWFYRHTSDHHTDLMKIFNNVIILIALFGIFSWGITHFKMEHHSYEKQYVGSVMSSAVVLDIRKKSYSLTESDFKKEKQDLQSLSLKQNDFSETLSIIFFCFLFMVLFIGAVSIDCLKNKTIRVVIMRIRNILSCLVVLGVLILKPALLFPLVGQIFDDGLKVNFPVMQSLSVLYCILMFLMLFSLQKTARKNSIVPS